MKRAFPGLAFSIVVRWGLPLLAWGGWVGPAAAELTASQIVILTNQNDADSLSVAEHYADRRGIPADHIIELDLPHGESISRENYDRLVLRPVRRALEARKLAHRIRAVVTTYGIPLQVTAPRLTSQQKQWAGNASERLARARARLAELGAALRLVAPGEEVLPPSPSSVRPQSDPDELQLQQVIHEIRGAAGRLTRRPPGAEKTKEWTSVVAGSTLQFGGLDAFLHSVRPAKAEPPDGGIMLDRLRRLVGSAQAIIGALTEMPNDRNRERAYQLAEVVFGLRGVVRYAKVELEAFGGQDADASFDSELSLLWWEPGAYALAGRTMNPLQHERLWTRPPTHTAPRLPVLMVSRLDAPTPELARQLVDNALAAERQGLSGTVYVDAQGREPDAQFSYGFYDQSLRDAADLFSRKTSYAVVLDNTERRFSQPGEAPDVAVYIGWYRLRAYEDAFTFRPGAVGYHIASAEAISIHDPRETGWCKNALERGITVTLGSTGEPFVDAFPPPSQFLGFLLTGRYSLVEAYYLSTRYVSWRMVLFGDPLYNPWRGKALVDFRDLAHQPDLGLAGLPVAPADVPLKDPVQTAQQLASWRKTVQDKIDTVLGQLASLRLELSF
ncbi:MAG: TIGR03790 family protein [Acidobacteria bacterium]|nr:TIGR03790 family protein [Acidobacteriota bacterium]